MPPPAYQPHGLLFPQQNYVVLNAPATRGVPFKWCPFSEFSWEYMVLLRIIFSITSQLDPRHRPI